MTMTCEALQDRLPDYLEGTLDAEGRAALESHVSSCAACRALVADLQRVRQVALTLERHAPPRGAWNRVAARLQSDPKFQRAAERAPGRRPSGSLLARPALGAGGWGWLALAAGLVIALTATLVVLKRQLDAPPATARGPAASAPAASEAGNADSARLVESVETELQLAAEHYERAIVKLEQIANASDSPLDPEVMATVRQNLAVIDKAIGESRTALRTQPGSPLAQESLFDAFRRKVALLQDTIALMNEVRKGNQAGAARITEPDKS